MFALGLISTPQDRGDEEAQEREKTLFSSVFFLSELQLLVCRHEAASFSSALSILVEVF